MFVSYNYSSYSLCNYVKNEKGNIFEGNIEELPSDNQTPKGCSLYKIDDGILMYAPSRNTQAKAKNAWDLRENIAKITGRITITVSVITGIVGLSALAFGVIPGVILIAAAVVLLGVGILFLKLSSKAHEKRIAWETLEVDTVAKSRKLLGSLESEIDLIKDKQSKYCHEIENQIKDPQTKEQFNKLKEALGL